MGTSQEESHVDNLVPPLSQEEVELEKTSPPPYSNSPSQTVIKDPFASVYTKTEKWLIVTMISIAGIFSPLTANIYLPAIPTLALAFHKSVELINLTVTIYMVSQGVAPMFWGTLSDSRGRRLLFIACLLILSLSCVGLALVPTSAYWLLMVLRLIQAAGSASTIALGAGVIGDITRPEERAGMYGMYGVGAMLGPALGPVIGGVLDDRLGWRSIFWFMCIASAVCALFITLFLPETLRVIVGDGSIQPPVIYRPLIPIIGRKRLSSSPVERPKPKPWVNPLPLLANLDIMLLLLFNGIGMSMFYCIGTSTSTLFLEKYTFLTVAEVGYCYLGISLSMAVAAVVCGKFLDVDYRRIKKSMMNIDTSGCTKEEIEKAMKQPTPPDFPAEYARLRMSLVLCVIMVTSYIAYGWCLDRGVSLAAAIVLQGIFGFSLTWVFNSIQTLLIDLMPTRGSSITACNNLIRCSTSAVMISVLQLILDALGIGWTFTLLGGLGVIGTLLLLIEMRVGPKCRQKRARSQEKKP